MEIIRLKLFENQKRIIIFLSLVIITVILVNYFGNSPLQYKETENGNILKIQGYELKKEISYKLVNAENYSVILSNKCEVTGDLHDRHKLRWVKIWLLKNIYIFGSNINETLPYYLNIFLHSILLFLTLIILNKTFKLEILHIIFYLLFICFIFQQQLSEYSFSIFELFFASMCIYASKIKNLILLSLLSFLAILNRESGIILLLSWFIFNNDYKKIIISLIIISISYLLINYRHVNCMINPAFFVPFEYQKNQVNFSDIKDIGIISTIKLFTINFIIPFGIIFYNYIVKKIRNKSFLIITLIYLVTFLVATPLLHISTKMIILPLILTSFHLHKFNKIKS